MAAHRRSRPLWAAVLDFNTTDHEAIALLEEAAEVIALADRSGDADAAIQGHVWCLTASREAGDHATAEAHGRALAGAADRLRQPRVCLLASSRASTLAHLHDRVTTRSAATTRREPTGVPHIGGSGHASVRALATGAPTARSGAGLETSPAGDNRCVGPAARCRQP